MRQVKSITERFFEKIRMPEDPYGCWEWTASPNQGGYGRFVVFGNPQLLMLAHRFSYIFHKGAIPTGLMVLHTCDNPICVNPNHLYAGDHIDNSRDLKERGNRRIVPLRGEVNGRSKLTNEDVFAIRARAGENQAAIAREYGVSPVLIGKIMRRKMWGHI